MKKTAILFGLIISSFVFACKCNNGNFGENFAQNDFIAEIEVLKTYNFDLKRDDERFYKAEIKILKLYKGRAISNILVNGRVEEVYGPACEIRISKGDKFLVYLSKDDDFLMSSCTAKKFLNDKNINTEREALTFLMNKNIKKTNVSYLSDDHFMKFRDLNPKNNFAVYKIKTDSRSKAVSISAIQNFGTSKDDEIISIIKNELVFFRGFFQDVKNEEIWLVLFFDTGNNYILSGSL